jgi:hypothetical protein
MRLGVCILRPSLYLKRCCSGCKLKRCLSAKEGVSVRVGSCEKSASCCQVANWRVHKFSGVDGEPGLKVQVSGDVQLPRVRLSGLQGLVVGAKHQAIKQSSFRRCRTSTRTRRPHANVCCLAPGHGPRATGHGPRATDHGPRTTDDGRRTSDDGRRTRGIATLDARWMEVL